MKNVLLIVLDAVRKDHLSPYGYDRPTTPELDDFAESATQYEQAIAAAPWTPPSHAAMFTGKYPSHCRVFGREPQLTTDQPVLAEQLSREGYNTLGFSNSYHTSTERGFDRGFNFYHDMQTMNRIGGQRIEASMSFLKSGIKKFVDGYNDFSYFQVDHLRQALSKDAEPFFGFINLNSAHSPYDPPSEFKSTFENHFDKWGSVEREVVRSLADNGYEYMMGDKSVTEAEWELMQCWYDGEIAYVDSLLGTLFDFLREHNIYDNTTIIITSDHGEHFGEDGLMYHQFSLSEILLNVPLLIKWPNQTERVYNRELVSLTDIAPTCLDLITGEYPNEMDGRSLRSESPPDSVYAEYGRPTTDLLERLVDAMFSEFSLREESLSERLNTYQKRVQQYDRGLQAIRTANHKLVRSTAGDTELYRIDDRARSITDEQRRATLSEQLDDILGKLPTGSHDEELPDHVEEHLEEMGYL